MQRLKTGMRMKRFPLTIFRKVRIMTHTRWKKRRKEFEFVEYSDLPFAVPHQIERNTRNILITFVCTRCDDEYTETYARQYPDRLARQLNCPRCYTHTYHLINCIPNTVYYRSTAMEHASFSDDTSKECFECGVPAELHPFTFSNGMQVQLCTKHQHRYLKSYYKLTTTPINDSDEEMERAGALWLEQVETDRNKISQWGYFDEGNW